MKLPPILPILPLLIMLIILLAACGGENFDSNYLSVKKLKSFTVNQDSELKHFSLKAIELWNESLNYDLLNQNNNAEIEIILDDIELPGLATMIGDVCLIRIQKTNYENTLYNEKLLINLIAHELGHCLGLSHDDSNKNSIMYHSVYLRQYIPDYLVDLIYERYNL